MAKFRIGQVLATMAVLEFCRLGVDLGPLIDRHRSGDWGDADADTKAENDKALKTGGELRSVYHPHGRRVWIVTNKERTATVVRFPADEAQAP